MGCPDSVMVPWPATLALVVPHLKKAFEMRFQNEVTVEAVTEFPPISAPVDRFSLTHKYHCQVVDAYYIAGAVARPLDGKNLPKGKLSIYLDLELLISGDLESFLPSAEPFDCMKSLPWETNTAAFTAHPMIDGRCDLAVNRQIGFMATSGATVHVRVETQEPAKIEIKILSALYTTMGRSPIQRVGSSIATTARSADQKRGRTV